MTQRKAWIFGIELGVIALFAVLTAASRGIVIVLIAAAAIIAAAGVR